MWDSLVCGFLFFYDGLVPLGMVGFFIYLTFYSDTLDFYGFSLLKLPLSIFFWFFCRDFPNLAFSPYSFLSLLSSFYFIFTISFFNSSLTFSPVTTNAYFSKKVYSPRSGNYMSLDRFWGPHNVSDWNIPRTFEWARISIFAIRKPSLRSWSFLKLCSQFTKEYKSIANTVH